MMMMKWKKRTFVFLMTAAFISTAVVSCIFFIPLLTKMLEKKETSKNTTGLATRKFPEAGSMLKNVENHKFDSTSTAKFIGDGVCSTEDCVMAAARILKYMDTKVDPCEDFYKYSCGKFLVSHSIPETWDSFGTQDISNQELDVTVKSVLEEPDKINQSDSLTKAKTVYQTCINTHHIDDFGVQDLRDVLSNTGVGDWPFLNSDWKDCRLDIEWRMAKLNSMGLDSLFRLETKFEGEDFKLSVVLRLAEPLVDGICDDDPYNMTIALEKAAEHREILVSVLKLLDVDVTNVTDIDIDELFEFDFQFCNATKESRLTGPAKDIDSLNMTLLNLADMAPQINWMRWRDLIFSELRLNFPHDKQRVYVDGMQAAIKGIDELLRNTNSKVQANYLTWRFVIQHLGFLGKEFRQILESHSRLLVPKMSKLLMSSDRWIPRWRQCVLYVKTLMPLSILIPYSEHIQVEKREGEMHSVTSLVKDEFKMILKDTKSLKSSERSSSSHKLDLVQFYLTYLYKNKDFFNSFYMDVGIISDSFLKNGLKLNLSRMKKLLEGVSRSKTMYDMEYTIQTIYSAFGSEMYSFFHGNQIVISLGALQACPVEDDKLKHRSLPMFMTLSTFGWMIGHELAHGFDTLALDGSRGRNWTVWQPNVVAYSKWKAHCFLNKTDAFKMSVDEALETTSLNEDLCDNQAIFLAHRAYLRYLSSPHEDETLPGIQLSPKQLFFVSYAQQFCELRRPGNVHSPTSPGRDRVNKVLANYGAFSTTFNCPKNKPMNPQHRCDYLWI